MWKNGETWCENPPKGHFCLRGWGWGLANGHHKGRENGGKWGKIGTLCAIVLLMRKTEVGLLYVCVVVPLPTSPPLSPCTMGHVHTFERVHCIPIKFIRDKEGN